MNFDDLKNPELQEKLKACKTMSELAELAEAEGIELNDEELDSLSGGNALTEWANQCPKKDCAGYVHYDSCPKYTNKQEPLVI